LITAGHLRDGNVDKVFLANYYLLRAETDVYTIFDGKGAVPLWGRNGFSNCECVDVACGLSMRSKDEN